MKLTVTEEFLWDIYSVLEKAGDVAGFILNPRAVKFMPGIKNPIFEKYRHQKSKMRFEQLLYYAKRKKYIRIKSSEGNKTIILTKEGLSKALKASFKIELKGKRKDGKWIMLVFDIPQKYRKSRDLLRSILCSLGYKLFQQSVWVTPYDVLSKTEESLQFYSLDKFVKLFLIEKV